MQANNLDVAIDSIRVRFGSQALTRAAELPPPQPWSSGTAVDHLTGIGGLPRGRLSLFTGSGTSGKLTLALVLLASATREFAHAVVIDGGGFDPWTLTSFSPEQGALTVVRAPAPEIAGEAAAILARAGAGFLLLMSEIPEHWLGPLESGAHRPGTVIVGGGDTPSRALAHASSLNLGFSRSGWVLDPGGAVGPPNSAAFLANRVAPPVGETELEICYRLGAQSVKEAPIQATEMETCASAAV